jgi:hypothetical protein
MNENLVNSGEALTGKTVGNPERSLRNQERATTIPKGSTSKWREAPDNRKVDDIVSSLWKYRAALKSGISLTS